MIVRPAERSDLPGILEIYNDVVASSNAIYTESPSTLQERLQWFESRTAQGHPVLVAVAANEVRGFASFGDFRPFPGYATTVEHSVHVHPRHRRAGVGRALLEALLPLAKGAGKHVCVGAIDGANTASLRLHETFGFTQVARMPEVARKFGRWLDLIFVQKIL